MGVVFYKLVVLFFVGAFVGDIIETIFLPNYHGRMDEQKCCCKIFSIVWDWQLQQLLLCFTSIRTEVTVFFFLIGTGLGGVYEYLCSVFTEIVFGKVFWDYSDITF